MPAFHSGPASPCRCRPLNSNVRALCTSLAVYLLIFGAITPTVQAADTVSELSRRSHISQPELNELLSNCNRHQLSMNICAFRDFVAVDLEMQDVLADKLVTLPSHCHATLQEHQAAWAMRRDKTCNKDADAEAEGGSIRPMVFSDCRTVATKARIALLKQVSSCKGLP